ncbi:MAG: Rho termination factor N-terminal domain-containing protein [Cyanobacteria bacterium J06597_16]
MGLSDIGNLLCLPFDEIQPGEPTEAHDFLIQECARLLRKSQRNWLPLVVKEVDIDQYEVIGNALVYEAIAEAGLNEAWCILADDSAETAELSSVLAQDTIPSVNLSKATRQQISAALDYLIKQPGSPLKGVNVATATNRIDEAPRKYWKTLQPITKLKCAITAGKKLKELNKVFYLEPEPLPEVITDPVLLESFTAAELKKMAKKRGIGSISKLKKADLVAKLAVA